VKTQLVLGARGSRARPLRLRGAGIQLLLLGATALWILTGGPVHILALLLSAVSLSLALLLLEGEKRRNAALQATLDRLSREVGVAATGQN
jgi:hypothetical protein